MATHQVVLLFSVLLLSGHVMSFSISSRHERSTDLAEALAILQRERRRVGADYLGSESLLGDRPLTLDDISDWLSSSSVGMRPVENKINPAWVSDGQFQDFDPRGLDAPVLTEPESPVVVEPTQKELDDIFDTNDDEGNDDGEDAAFQNQRPAFDALPEKKKKEEMMNVQGDKKVVQKKSISTEMAEAAVEAAENANSEDDLSLDSLTKEEFRALMKAVGKLQKQASKLEIKTVEDPAEKVTVVETVEDGIPSEPVAIVQPASDEELKSVFQEEEGPLPFTRETDMTVEETPNSDSNRIIQETVMSNVSPSEATALLNTERELTNALTSELENTLETEAERAEEAEEEMEEELGENSIAGLRNYNWLVNNYLGERSPLKKRTAKRAVGLYQSQRSNDIDGDNARVDIAAPLMERLVAKIFELQAEVDKLKMVSRLEDLENDVLTDALNEATLAQREGSVSDTEFESLQQAIRIEEALQELKSSGDSPLATDDVSKRGEPWRRKRGPDVDAGSYFNPEDDGLTYPVSVPVERVPTDDALSKDEIQRLLNYYLMKAEEEEEEEEEDENSDSYVASLFMPNADQCPAVQEYSTNCGLADLYSLPVDYEARSLCNLHEMCYACGNSLRISQDHCDFVYRAAASALCQEKESCVLESEIFLRTMKLKTRYVPHSQPKCKSTCTAKFLGIM